MPRAAGRVRSTAAKSAPCAPPTSAIVLAPAKSYDASTGPIDIEEMFDIALLNASPSSGCFA